MACADLSSFPSFVRFPTFISLKFSIKLNRNNRRIPRYFFQDTRTLEHRCTRVRHWARPPPSSASRIFFIQALLLEGSPCSRARPRHPPWCSAGNGTPLSVSVSPFDTSPPPRLGPAPAPSLQGEDESSRSGCNWLLDQR